MNILVTGAAGMVGSHLIDELLLQNHTVLGLDDLSVGTHENISVPMKHPQFTFVKLDILDLESLFMNVRQADVIIHLAAAKKIGEDGSGFRTLNVNAKGTENILKLARALGSKVIFGSTSDVYGMSEALPFHEDGDLVLGPSLIKRWSYAVAKLYGEQLAYSFYKEFSVPVVVLRYFGAFSERSSFLSSGGHIPIFIHAVLNDLELQIHGDGTQTRSMGHVSDLVRGTILAMNAPKAVGEIINLGNTEEMSVIDSARLVHRLAGTGKELKLKFIPLRELFGEKYRDIERRIPDLTKAKNLLGFEPRVKMEDAIRMTLKTLSQRPA